MIDRHERWGAVAGVAAGRVAGTRDTLQLWTQIVGKVRMASTPADEPLVERAALRDGAWADDVADPARRRERSRSTSTSSTTASTSPCRTARRPRWRSSRGTVADFYARADGARSTTSGCRRRSGRCRSRSPTRSRSTTTRSTRPTTPSRPQRFWLALVQMDRVFEVFRSRFVGKVSPVHLFWGALDLAVTRFSGRPGPAAPRRRAELRARTSCTRPTRTRSAAPATGRARTARASSTPTPTRSRTASRDADLGVPGAPLRRRARRVRPARTRPCARPSDPDAAPAGVPPIHLRAAPPTSPAGTAPPSNVVRDGVVAGSDTQSKYVKRPATRGRDANEQCECF